MPLAHRVRPDSRLSLADIDPDDTGSIGSRDEAAPLLAESLAKLVDLQQRLLAEARQGLLVVFQAMDAAGKDGVIRKVVGPLDSRGVHVWSFKVPSAEEAAHDFLWRGHARAPRLGEIAVFNRSYYEDVLAVRVLGLQPKSRWSPRFDHINAWEAMLRDEGTRVVKIFLHISKAEQARRFQERLDDPTRRWKFDPKDLDMRARWDDFQDAYEDALSRCSTADAPWFVVPADKKWFRDLAVARLLVDTLEDMDPRYPEPAYDPSTIRIR